MPIPRPPFIVPWTPHMRLQMAGPRQHVFTVERCLFTAAIYEYDEPLSRCREWMYPTVDEAQHALLTWLTHTPHAPEPADWIRAVDAQGIRRATDYTFVGD